MGSPRLDTFQNFTDRRQKKLYGKHFRNYADSSTTSLNSSSNNTSSAFLSNRSSVYAPNIERQLNSLIIDDENTKEETAELLQQTFDQMDLDSQHQQSYIHSHLQNDQHLNDSHKTADFSQIDFRKSDYDVASSSRSSMYNEDNSNKKQVFAQGFATFTSLFVEQPVIYGRYPDFYIPTPTSIRNYLDYPNAEVLKSMKLPYPFRVKQPVSQRMERLGSANLITKAMEVSPDNNYINQGLSKHPTDSSKRHTLALGQINQLLQKDGAKSASTKPIASERRSKEDHHNSIFVNSSKSMLSDQAKQDILRWIPDQDGNPTLRVWKQDDVDPPFPTTCEIPSSPEFVRDNNRDLPCLQVPEYDHFLDKSPGNQRL